MRQLDFELCPSDPDVWMRPSKKSDGSKYYDYVLLYTDDLLCISENKEDILRDIGKYFELKLDTLGPHKIYLGGLVRKVELNNGGEAWAFSASQYVRAAIKNVETYIGKKDRWNISKSAETPMVTTYRFELYVYSVLVPHDVLYYMSLIGILR